jgi:hypothetical protein
VLCWVGLECVASELVAQHEGRNEGMKCESKRERGRERVCVSEKRGWRWKAECAMQCSE